MCVDVHRIIISDAGSTPATSTRLRFELAKKEAEHGVVPYFGTKPVSSALEHSRSKLRRSTTRLCFITFIYWRVSNTLEIIMLVVPLILKDG